MMKSVPTSLFNLSRQHQRHLSLIALALILSLWPGILWGAARCSGAPGSETLSFPPISGIPRDSPTSGVALTPWVMSESSQRWWTCYVTNATYTGSWFKPGPGLQLTGNTFLDDGINYKILATGIPGVGIIMGQRPFPNGCSNSAFLADLADLKTGGGQYSGAQCNQSGTVYNGGWIKARLIKTGVISETELPGMQIAQAYPVVNFEVTPSAQIKLFNIAPVTFTILSCETSNVSVDLGSHHRKDLEAPNQTSQAKPFQIELKNCPPGINTVKYRLDPLTTVLVPGQSVVALNSSEPQATGIGVQLLNNTGAQPLPLSTNLTATGFSGSGNFQIPLQARYYRTETRVTKGIANTSLSFTLFYE